MGKGSEGISFLIFRVYILIFVFVLVSGASSVTRTRTRGHGKWERVQRVIYPLFLEFTF